ncbi:hypothetical protein AB4672_21555 [Bacillus paralicheniformis]|uniref:hypothetical protein n=1 Tax=Bacillus paralicheniformis TaxID=1648923 RepID=UPI0034D35253
MKTLNENTIQFLLEKGFELKVYEDQGSTFYTKEITDNHTLKKLIEHHYEVEEGHEINTDGVSFIMEIQINGESPQWLFTGGCEMHDILEDQYQFVDYVKGIENVIKHEENEQRLRCKTK